MDKPVKFLLVDDVEENLVALSALLEREGLELHTARSGTEALELVLAHDFALALLDVQMPEMDGFELAELMRGSARSRTVPIIFVTAGPRDQNRLFAGYESGAVDFLFKPIDANILRHKAEVFFQLHRQGQQLARRIEEHERLVHDVTETLRLNETFTAALGHDLRNPLNAVMAGAALLAHRAPDDPTPKRIVASGRRMAHMIDQLLDLARARLAGGIPLQPGDVDVGILAETIVVEQQSLAPERRILLEAAGDLRGHLDEPRLAQVLSNLIANAVKHGAADGAVTVRLDGGQAERIGVRVHNPGVICAEARASLFAPFRSGERSNRHAEGLGLGLYIVDQIVKAHGGNVEVHSTEADGTTFEVHFPRRFQA
ncbi:MAG TPA: hybrid sensor histidine kinase/response regulator [Polyangia bacterium]|jgi:signal transduction histidine kinase